MRETRTADHEEQSACNRTLSADIHTHHACDVLIGGVRQRSRDEKLCDIFKASVVTGQRKKKLNAGAQLEVVSRGVSDTLETSSLDSQPGQNARAAWIFFQLGSHPDLTRVLLLG